MYLQANVVFSVRAAGSLIMLLIILPGTKLVLQNVWRLHTKRVDFLLAALSNLCLIIGSLCMGLASTVPAFFFGKSSILHVVRNLTLLLQVSLPSRSEVVVGRAYSL